MEVQLMLSRTPRIAVPHQGQVGTQCSITVKERNQQWDIILRRRWIVYLSSWWPRFVESLPRSGFLGRPLSWLALWRLIHHDSRGSLSFHQFFQWRRSRSHSWNWAWWLVIYRTPLPIQAWRIKFNVLKRSIRMVGRGIHQAFFLKRNSKLPLRQKQILHPGLYTKDGPIHRKYGSTILATRSWREWKRGWI